MRLTFSVKKTFGIPVEGVGDLSLMTGGRVAISDSNQLLIYNLNDGQKIGCLDGSFTAMTEVAVCDGNKRLLVYNFNDGQKMWNLEGRFTGMTEVTLAGKPCLAISFR